MNKFSLSASSIGDYKACPTRYYLKYIKGIRPVEETESQRYGSTWHKCLEILGFKPNSVCPVCQNTMKNPECPLCGGTDVLPDNMMDAVIRYLDQCYAEKPISKTPEEWMTERAVLLYSLAGYNWYYSSRGWEIVAEEIEFDLPLINPVTNRTLPLAIKRGKIDKIVRDEHGCLYVLEHKSTSKSIDSDSDYWNHLTLDTQTTLYLSVAQELQLSGGLEEYSVKPTDPLISRILYDVWHRPQIRPKKLTQADSKKFIETGEYLGEKFEVIITYADGDNPPMTGVFINDKPAEIEPGAKEGTFAIRETPEMFGTRLLADISERPEYYFCCKDIPKTAKNLNDFRNSLCNIYYSIKNAIKNETWYTNERQCEATFKCPYTSICYNGVDVNEIVPEGFIVKENKNASNTKTI